MSSNLVPNTFPTCDGIVPNVAPIFGDMTFSEDTTAPQIVAQVSASAPAKPALTFEALRPALEAAGRVAEQAQMAEDRAAFVLDAARAKARALDEQIAELREQLAQAERDKTAALDDFLVAQEVSRSAIQAERIVADLTDLL